MARSGKKGQYICHNVLPRCSERSEKDLRRTGRDIRQTDDPVT
jgi:hypothetical protein